MRGICLGILALAWSSLAHAGDVYRCMKDGAVTFGDQPCDAGDNQAVLGYPSAEDRTDIAPRNAEAPLAERIIGRWRWIGDNGEEMRTFHPGGRFAAIGEDQVAKTTGRGTWRLKDQRLTIRARFRNTHRGGGEVTVDNVLRYTVESLDADEMVLRQDRYDHASHWDRL